MKENMSLSATICTLLLLTLLSFSSCQNDVDFDSFEDNIELVFNINKHELDLTRSYQEKEDWSAGDCIYIIADESFSANSTDVFMVKLGNDGKWTSEGLVNFFKSKSNTSGTITAIYSPGFSYYKTSTSSYYYYALSFYGEIVYTNEGTYTKKGNMVFIDLDLNKRPNSRIRIEGISPSSKLYVKEVRNGSYKTHFNWDYNTDYIEPFYKDENEQVYFGLLDNSNGKTRVRILCEDGSAYVRDYNNVLTSGVAISLKGPLSDESEMWKNTIGSIELKTNEKKMIVGDEYDLLYSVSPSQMTDSLVWESSNPNVVSVTSTGHIEALQLGTATITATSKDGYTQSSCEISVVEITDFITMNYELISSTVGGNVNISFKAVISNKSQYDIEISDAYIFVNGEYYINASGSLSSSDLKAYSSVLYKGNVTLKASSFSWSSSGSNNIYGVEICFYFKNKYYKKRTYAPWAVH